MSPMTIHLWALAALAGPMSMSSPTATAQEQPPSERAGTVYAITRDVQSEDKGSNGSSGSSTDHDTMVERVVSVRPEGLELEYDLPTDTTAEDRARQWQFPVRVFRPVSGLATIRNAPELEQRLEEWLRAGKLTRAACGHWYFSWNAFKIECDPQSTLKTVADFDLRQTGLGDGVTYQDPLALEPTMLKKAPDGSSLVGEMVLDPQKVRQGLAEGDVATAEILQKPITLEEALRARLKTKVSGTVTVKIDLDAGGGVHQRTTVTKLETVLADGTTSQRTTTVTVTRNPLVAGTKRELPRPSLTSARA